MKSEEEIMEDHERVEKDFWTEDRKIDTKVASRMWTLRWVIENKEENNE